MRNIFIYQDMLKNYKSKMFPARCTLKIDLKKAYDSLNWDIRKLLIGLNVATTFVGWIMDSITTSSYPLSVDGGFYGFFDGRRAIRQGHLISSLP